MLLLMMKQTIAINETYITPQAPPLNRDTKVHFELFTASEEDAQATQTSPMFTQIEQNPKSNNTFQFALSNVTYEIVDTSTLVGQPTRYENLFLSQCNLRLLKLNLLLRGCPI